MLSKSSRLARRENWRAAVEVLQHGRVTGISGNESELVIGFVGPVGVASARFHETAIARLRKFGYHPELIRLSQRLDDLKAEGLLSTQLVSEPEFQRIRSHMDAGDELRGLGIPRAQGLVVAAAITRIAAQRARDSDGRTKPILRHAWLFSSLKNPAEVDLLRRIYGSGFFLVGLSATEAERRALLERGMSPDEATELIERDTESENKHGQQTQKTFELADVWVRDEAQLCRFLDLVFGDPFKTPTDDEDGMALAYVSSLRSADLSRQVGAAIVAPSGEVLATGRNEVPAPGGGQYSAPEDGRPTARDCDVGNDSNVKERQAIEKEIAAAVADRLRAQFAPLGATLDVASWTKLTQTLDQVQNAVTETLPRTRLRDITEYGRAVHAEMSALMSAVRLGISLRGATLYCTTFPCHNCAKHIAAAGIARVVFVEPYAKSKARDLHADSIVLVGESTEPSGLADLTADIASQRTRFEPFLGVGPRRYFDLFSMRLGTGRSVLRKNDRGDAIPFAPREVSPRIPLASVTYLDEEVEAAGILVEAKAAKGILT